METVEDLTDRIVDEFRNLILDVSGPWGNGEWIANFRDRDNMNNFVHAGSSGSTMLEALKAGYAYVKDRSASRDVPAP